MKTQHQVRVESFMEGAQQQVPAAPQLPSPTVANLRARLIIEEALETCSALGVVVKAARHGFLEFSDLEFVNFGSMDLVEIADGCADLSVVAIGTLSACGIGDAPLLEEVDLNNLMKIANGTLRDGKFIKPANHPAPRIREVLEAQTQQVQPA